MQPMRSPDRGIVIIKSLIEGFDAKKIYMDGQTLIMVTHEPQLANLADRCTSLEQLSKNL